MSRRSIDPYKKVWDSVEDHESVVQDWTKNGTLFVPTWEEMAYRYMSKARYLLRHVSKLGRTAEGISVFNEVLIYRNLAKKCFDQHHELMVRSR